MSELLVRSKESPDIDGNVIRITPESAGWNYVRFEVYKLEEGETFTKETGNNEVAVVLLSGRANAKTNEKEWGNIGDRMSVFEKKPAYAVYAPNDDTIEIEALTDLEFAVCSAPGKGTHAARLIKPEDVHVSTRGSGNMEREIHGVLPEEEPADSLFVIEVFT